MVNDYQYWEWHRPIGAPNLAPEILVQNYLAGSLVSGANVCDH